MKFIATFGEKEPSINYSDRLTVKVIIKNSAGKILILNDGLLPGGGVHQGETNEEALAREVAEECGMTIDNIATLGSVIQYREYLAKRYIVHVFTADLQVATDRRNPRDAGEIAFKHNWLSIEQAKVLLRYSIREMERRIVQSDEQQGPLYNRKMTLAALECI